MEIAKEEKEELVEQQKWYNNLTETVGNSLTLFYCCIAFDVPFEPKALPENINTEADVWIKYCESLKEQGLDKNDGEELGFVDGQTDIMQIFGENLEKGQFFKELRKETGNEKKPGTIRQRKNWGTGGSKNPYSSDDYNELDRIYQSFSYELRASGGVTVRQELTLRECSKLYLDMETARQDGDVRSVKTINDTIQSMLSSENLRKKDSKPIESEDSAVLTQRLEQEGLLKGGKLVSPEEIWKYFFSENHKPKFKYTADATEKMMLFIKNTTNTNDGLPEITRIPDIYSMKGCEEEFAAEPNEAEIEAYQKLGLIRDTARWR